MKDMNNTATTSPTATVVRVAFGWVGCSTCSDGVSRAVTCNFRTEAEAVAAVAEWNAAN